MENLRTMYQSATSRIKDLMRTVTARRAGSLDELIRLAEGGASAFTIEPVTFTQGDRIDLGTFGGSMILITAYDRYLKYSVDCPDRRVIYLEYLGTESVEDMRVREAEEKSQIRGLLSAVLRGQSMTALLTPSIQIIVKGPSGVLDDEAEVSLLERSQRGGIKSY